MRPANGYFFEDYQVGQKFAHAVPRTLTDGDAALYQALTGSRNPLHCSVPFAQALGHPTTPVDDLLVFHIAFGKTVPDISYNAVANLGYADGRFVKPVYVGDTLTAETEIVGLKGNRNGKTGVVHVRSNCHNQRGELVLTWVRWVMVHRREAVAEGEAAAQGITDFPASVDAAKLASVRLADRSTVSLATGSDAYWEDIAASDDASFILHPAGMTLDETDHTLATKLYQNTARVHFDLHHMAKSRFGKRLVYGGQVISLCRAMAFDGLANALSIAAINGGSHHNPTFAGDTLYARSLPMSKWALNETAGALRLQLQGWKNVDPAAPEFAQASPEQHVLTLDLTVILPRR